MSRQGPRTALAICVHECSDDEFALFRMEELASTADAPCAAKVAAVFNESPSCRLVWQPKSNFFDRMGGQAVSFAEHYNILRVSEVRKHDDYENNKKENIKNSPASDAAMRVDEVHGCGGLLGAAKVLNGSQDVALVLNQRGTATQQLARRMRNARQ